MGAESRGVDAELQMLRRMRRSPNVSLHTSVFHDKFNTRRNDQNGTAKQDPSFWMEGSAIAPGPSHSPLQGCTAPGDAFCLPPGAPLTHSAPAAPSDRQVDQLVGRAADREVEVRSGFRQGLSRSTTPGSGPSSNPYGAPLTGHPSRWRLRRWLSTILA